MKKLLLGFLLLAAPALADVWILIPGAGGSGGGTGNVNYALSAGTVQDAIASGALTQMNAAIAAASGSLQSQITVITTNAIDPVARSTANTAQTNSTNGLAQAQAAQSTANTAQNNATNGLAQAQAAQSTANTAQNNATNGLAQAQAAQSTANTAQNNATNGLAQAQAAQSTANTAQNNATNGLAQAQAAQSTATSALNLASSLNSGGTTNTSVAASTSVSLAFADPNWATHNLWFTNDLSSDMTVTMTNLSVGTLYNGFVRTTGSARNITLVLQPSGSRYYYGTAATNVWQVTAGAYGTFTVQKGALGDYHISRGIGAPQ